MGFPKPALTPEYFTFVLLWALPTTAQCILMFFEGIRTIPGEVRMMLRIYRRGRPNIVEIIFFVIKYIATLATIMSVLQEWTTWLNATGCLAASWILQLGLSLCTTLVSTSLAWRCYVIFQRNRRVGLAIAIGLTIHLGMSIFAALGQAKYDTIQEDYCGWSAEMLRKNHSHRWYQIHASWFMLYSTFFDTALVVGASWRLLKFVRGPTGLQRIGRLLFINNLHYLALVSTLNLIQFFVLCFRFSSIPPLMWLTETLQIIVCLQMLISEQDEAHGYGSRGGHHTAYRGAGAGGGGYGGHGRTPGSSMVPLKSGTTSKSTFGHQTSIVSSLDHAEMRQPLEGIRFDAIHSESIVDRDTTMSQIQAGMAKEYHDQQAPNPAAPWTYQSAPTVSQITSSPPSGGQATPYSNYDATSPYTGHNSSVPSYPPDPPSFHTSPPASIPDDSPKSPRPPKSGGGLSIKQIRANLDHQKQNSLGGFGGGTNSSGEEVYAMKPLSAHSDAGSTTGRSPRRKRTASSHSTASVCTCSRGATQQQQQHVSYGTALTRELTQRELNQRDTTLSNVGGGNTNAPATHHGGGYLAGASLQVDTTIQFDGTPSPTIDEHQQAYQPQSPPSMRFRRIGEDQQHGGRGGGGHHHQHIEEMATTTVNPDAPFSDYNSPVRYRF